MPSADNRIEDQTEVDSRDMLFAYILKDHMIWVRVSHPNSPLGTVENIPNVDISHFRLLSTMAAPAASRFQRYRSRHIRLIVVYGTQKLDRRQCISVSLPHNSLNSDANVRVIPMKLNYTRLVETRIDILGHLL
jgi:hypothetical protein